MSYIRVGLLSLFFLFWLRNKISIEVHKDKRQKSPSPRTANPMRSKVLTNDKKKDKSLNSREIEAHEEGHKEA